jgi:hypothetical protein
MGSDTRAFLLNLITNSAELQPSKTGTITEFEFNKELRAKHLHSCWEHFHFNRSIIDVIFLNMICYKFYLCINSVCVNLIHYNYDSHCCIVPSYWLTDNIEYIMCIVIWPILDTSRTCLIDWLSQIKNYYYYLLPPLRTVFTIIYPKTNRVCRVRRVAAIL